MKHRIPEPCLCGDPECPRCFPQPRKHRKRDADAEIDALREMVGADDAAYFDAADIDDIEDK